MSDNISKEASWPPWKIALAVGIPMAIVGVGGYYYYSSRSDKKSPTSSKKSEPLRVEPEGSSSPLKIPVTESPLQSVKSESIPVVSKLDEAQNYKNEGNQLFKDGNYQDAIGKYTKAIIACPKDKKLEKSTYHQNKAAALEKLSDWFGVIDECSAAIDLNQKYVKALHRRAKAYEKVGEKEKSLEDVTTACILEGFQNQASMMFADNVLKELGKEKATDKYKNRKPVIPSNLFVKQYFASFREDVISNPLTDETKALSSTSGYVRAKLLLDAGNYKDIIHECTDEIDACRKCEDDFEKDKDNPSFLEEALVLRGTFHVLTGNSKAALSDFNEIINIKDADIKLKANAFIKRGSMHMQQQNIEKAEADFDSAMEVDPENCDVFHHRGQLNILLDKGNKALVDFDKCINLAPDFALAYGQRCYTKYRLAVNQKSEKDIEKAMNEFEEVLRKYPNCTETYGLYAQAQTDKENYDKADQLFLKALEIEPDNATLHVHRGLLVLQWKQDLEQAVKFISQALEIDEKCDFAHETMGTIEVQRGNLDKAKEHFDVSIEYAKSELELAHLYALRAAAVAQANIAKKYGLRPVMPPGIM